VADVGDVLENPVTGERFTVLAVPRYEDDWGKAEILFPPGPTVHRVTSTSTRRSGCR
jgi:hypothetical protein